MYGHTWNANTDGDFSCERSDIKAVCGDFPAILGLDLGELELGGERNLDGNLFTYIRDAAVKHYERGGLVSLSWHPRNPMTGGDAWDTTPGTVATILPGGANHDKFMGWLDAVADYISTFKDAGGNPIPLMFRPWHEHDAGWFWWGVKGPSTPEEYNALWVMTWRYLREERGLDNLVWVISPNETGQFDTWTSAYPGDEYVDVVGFDCYEFIGPEESFEVANERYVANIRRCLEFQTEFCKEHSKVLALTETGFEGIPCPDWWSSALLKAVEGFPISYVLTWRNASDRPGHFYGPFEGCACADDFTENFYKSGKTLFLKDLK